MSSSSKRITAATALLLVFAISQVYVGVSFAGPVPVVPNATAAPLPQGPTGILTTRGNKQISVNGISAISGATIMSGAAIETPDGTGATVSLGSLGSLDISPKTKLTLEFQSGSVKVTVTEGCLTLHTKKGTTGEVDTPKGVAGKTDGTKDGAIRICPDRTGGAVAGAGAGGLFGLGTAATVAVIAGGATAIILPVVLHGGNPSPLTP
ncbi:MAG: hypothetical protein JWM21_4090 [Acidobacteria bacterium]|nr:hypothetical protein [Acidobacteriota bacterium]